MLCRQNVQGKPRSQAGLGAGLVPGSDSSQGLCRTTGDTANCREVAREGSCRIHLSVMFLQNFTSVAARKAPLLIYLFYEWIKQKCRTLCRVQRAGRQYRRGVAPIPSVLSTPCHMWQRDGSSKEKRERDVSFDAWS